MALINLALSLVFLAPGFSAASAKVLEPARKPNIIFLLADDLGYGELSCYGQQKFQTPNIDRLAKEGMKFTAHYSGNSLCAPSRCVLLSGKHPGHAYIRDNRGGFSREDEGQQPVPDGELQLPLTLKRLGYATGGFGKWDLGHVGTSGDPARQGFDIFYGYKCHAFAHNHYPTHLWSNDTRVLLHNAKFSAHQKLPSDADRDSPVSYAYFSGKDYAPDFISEHARNFIRKNQDRPFFLYYATTVPHVALQVPENSLSEFEGKLPDKPYDGSRSYLPHRAPHAAYAAMIARMDREVGRFIALVQELGLDENTIFIFASDNGPAYNRAGGTDTEFFNGTAGFRGRKGFYYEGGFRVPCLVRWKGKVMPGTASDRVTGFEDWLPTLLDLCDARSAVPKATDGVSFAPTLLGHKQAKRSFLYRETPAFGGQQCVRIDHWKLVRKNLNAGLHDAQPPVTELYRLATDPREATDVAGQYPDVVEMLLTFAKSQHEMSPLWPLRDLDSNSQ